MAKQNPTVEVAKEMAAQNGRDQIRTLSTGVRVRLVPVSAALLSEVTSRIKDPQVPLWRNEDKGRDEPNPSDPEYLRELDEASTKRGMAAMDAMVMFGVDLVDGVPEDDSWLKKLRFMEKKGFLDLSEYDLEDGFDCEFLYKRYIAIDNDTLTNIASLSSLTPEAIARAEDSFPGNEG